jgi:hypothetical protein
MKELEDQMDFLPIVIGRGEIESGNIRPTLAILHRLLVDKDTIQYFFERVDIGVNGYDDDTRELWDIPEVKIFIQKLDQRFPYWFYFLTKLGCGLKMVAFCCTNLIKLTDEQVWLEPASLKLFYNSHFIAVNELGGKIGMSNKKNEELTYKVIGYFS